MALILLFLTSLTIGGAFASRERDKMVMHTLEVLQELESYESSILGAELNRTRMDMIGKPADRYQLLNSLERAQQSVNRLIHLTSDNSRQQIRLTVLRNLTNQATASLRVQLQQEKYAGPNLVPYVETPPPPLPIAETLAEIRKEEQELLRQRQSGRTNADYWFGMLSAGGLSCNLLMVWWTYSANRKYVQQRNEREYEIRSLNFRLAEQVEEIRQLNASLEERVAEKTSELATTVAKLQRSNIELERFIYVAAHDLQEPLRQIASFNNLLAVKYGESLDAKGHHYLDYSIAGARRLQSMLQGLLEYSMITPAARNSIPLRIRTVIDGALADVAQEIRETNASVTVTGGADFEACVDRDWMRTVFRSLVSNALKFRSPSLDPRIEIVVNHNDEDWTATVSDNGLGIDSQLEDKVFVLFARLHPVGEYQGAGVGLAMSKRIIESHGGTIHICPNVERNGSVFRIQVPIRQPDVASCNGRSSQERGM